MAEQSTLLDLVQAQVQAQVQACWLTGILPLSYALRLQVQPPVPLPLLADFIKEHHLYKSLLADLQRVTPSQHDPAVHASNEEIKEWLVMLFEKDFQIAEEEKDWVWQTARVMNEQMIQAHLESIWFRGKGYTLAGEAEMELQMKWRREGDWRAGSEPHVESNHGRRPKQRSRRILAIGVGRPIAQEGRKLQLEG